MLERKKVLFIGLVWPEPTSSAAGYRILQLMDFFMKYKCTLHFASASVKGVHSFSLESKGVNTHAIKLNHHSFDEFIKYLCPDIVVFDRFISEEQFGWRVREQLPEAITILDTEDLHFLRKARATAFKKASDINLYTEDAIRELSSIYRCDLSLIISKEEMNILENTFSIPNDLLLYVPFMIDRIDFENNVNTFENRKDFMFVGNMLHEPNYQTVLQLKSFWNEVRKKIPAASLNIYGAYMSEKVLQLHQPKDGFRICDRCEDVVETMQQHRVLLAPIPFGAGIKGKFFDAMIAGLPSITTTIGAEGMSVNGVWNGYISDDVDEIVLQAVVLYSNQTLWLEKQQIGFDILENQYLKETFYDVLKDKVQDVLSNISMRRNKYFINRILNYQQFNATKFMSKWIEHKNR